MMLIRHAQSEWNHHFSRTRVDPGIRDPALTAFGREQAAALIDQLSGVGLAHQVASPYRRTLETAGIIAEALDLTISVNSLVRERCFFSCDIGSDPHELMPDWPTVDFAGLGDRWWGEPPESEAAIAVRCEVFRRDHADLLRRDDVAVISHWGFIRAFTGQEVENATVLPVGPDTINRPSNR
jgi:broad specificity phosphatase PhoE